MTAIGLSDEQGGDGSPGRTTKVLNFEGNSLL